MNKLLNKIWIRMTTWVILSIPFFATSCVDDNQDDCGLNVRFHYTYNVKNADAFSNEVKCINLYIFDEAGNFVRKYSDAASKFVAGHTMNIPDLHAGKYTLVCMGRSAEAVNENDQEFRFSKLDKGSCIDELCARLVCNKGVNCKQFAHLFIGKTTIQYNGGLQSADISLMKCSDSYRIILLPTSKRADFNTDNYDIKIMDANYQLDYQGELPPSLQTDEGDEGIDHTPYHTEVVTSGSSGNGGKSTSSREGSEILEEEDKDIALIYDLSSARLFREDDTRLVITDKRQGKVVFNHSLPWLLSLYGGEQRNKAWSDQEYLDRQDQYTVAFYVNDAGDYNFQAQVKVNGWNLNLIDTKIN